LMPALLLSLSLALPALALTAPRKLRFFRQAD
jgi:hypothetical protein